MNLFLSPRVLRVFAFTLAPGIAALISAEATALTMSVLAVLASTCRHPPRLELVLAGIIAFAARTSGATWLTLSNLWAPILTLGIALCGIAVLFRGVFGSRTDDCPECPRRRERWPQR